MSVKSNEWFYEDWIKQLINGETSEVNASLLKSLLVSGKDYNILPWIQISLQVIEYYLWLRTSVWNLKID